MINTKSIKIFKYRTDLSIESKLITSESDIVNHRKDLMHLEQIRAENIIFATAHQDGYLTSAIHKNNKFRHLLIYIVNGKMYRYELMGQENNEKEQFIIPNFGHEIYLAKVPKYGKILFYKIVEKTKNKILKIPKDSPYYDFVFSNQSHNGEVLKIFDVFNNQEAYYLEPNEKKIIRDITHLNILYIEYPANFIYEKKTKKYGNIYPVILEEKNGK